MERMGQKQPLVIRPIRPIRPIPSNGVTHNLDGKDAYLFVSANQSLVDAFSHPKEKRRWQ
jgi:hypothetical protein